MVGLDEIVAGEHATLLQFTDLFPNFQYANDLRVFVMCFINPVPMLFLLIIHTRNTSYRLKTIAQQFVTNSILFWWVTTPYKTNTITISWMLIFSYFQNNTYIYICLY